MASSLVSKGLVNWPWRERKMEREYRLIKLRAETVQELKGLMAQTGKGSLDDLISVMIRLMDTYRLGLKETGWYIHSKGDESEVRSVAARR